MLVDDTGLSCLLDFGHARFLDPLSDFGKLHELVFERWSAPRRLSSEGPESTRPLADDAVRRIDTYRGFRFLYPFSYFSIWSRHFLDEHRDRLGHWTAGHP